MKNKNAVIILFLVLSSPLFSYAKKVMRKPNQTEISAIKIKVIYGDKITLFSVEREKSGGRVDFSNNSGTKDSKEISSKDYDFLKNKILKISGVSNDRAFCVRNYISVNFNNKELIGCIGAQNSFAKEIQETVNLVSILF